MKWGDTVYVVLDGHLRTGEYRGVYENNEHRYKVWMTSRKSGQSPFRDFEFYPDEIFTDIEKAKKAEFKAKLSGRYVKA